MVKLSTNFKPILMIAGAAMLWWSCGEQSVRSSEEMSDMDVDSTRTSIVNVSGKLFSIPSPIQTAILIKDSKTPYNRDVLNDPKNVSNYASNTSRALNLGVYGTEMAYTSLFDDGQASLRYYKAVDELANGLGIKGAIDAALVQRLGANVGNSDSLLILSGKFYEEADRYLKENERYDIAALVLAGGWVESSYLTALAAKGGNMEAKQRLAEQYGAVKTLSEVLKSVADSEFAKGAFMKGIEELETIYSQLEVKYTYMEPVTNPEKKLTVIKSETKFEMNDEQVQLISDKINALRAEIIR